MFSAGRANLKILRVCCTIFSVIISKRNFLFEVLSDNSLAGPGSCLARAGDKLGFDVQRRGSQARGGAYHKKCLLDPFPQQNERICLVLVTLSRIRTGVRGALLSQIKPISLRMAACEYCLVFTFQSAFPFPPNQKCCSSSRNFALKCFNF